jgi:hypothetical protein
LPGKTGLMHPGSAVKKCLQNTAAQLFAFMTLLTTKRAYYPSYTKYIMQFYIIT